MSSRFLSSSFKHRVIGAGFRAVAATGADRWLAPLARGEGAILMFHHVRPARPDPFQPNRLLEITPEHLDRTLTLVRRLGYAIVPLDEVPDRLRRGGGRFVALTFDDGYRDNRDHALPILTSHDAPWTMFVTTDYASGEGRLWWLELEEVIRRSDEIGLDGRTLPSRTFDEKNAAFAAAYADLRAGPEPRLREIIGAWCDEAGIDRRALVRSLCLGWDEIAALSQETGLTIGAHTLTHPMLAKHDEATARREIVESRGIIAERLGREIRHLAYPVGNPGSAGPREFRLAREAGYGTAVTTRPGHLFPAHADHLAALPRVSVNGLYQSEAAVRALMSGVPFLLWNRGRRLDVG
ncbi:polysaccharide deacetylase family protein [uncultured Enterovirga sp.]|uniref:polysaccharide deacetylase family protein n=1 Tax=uncultured Enterovirga sp. TaxID=2026352 RepID=UPI0035CBF7E7